MQSLKLMLAAAAGLAVAGTAHAVPVTVVNGDIEAYDTSGGRVNIDLDGVDPLGATGFRASAVGDADSSGVFASQGPVVSGVNRLVIGASNVAPGFADAPENTIEQYVAFQETLDIADAGDEYTLTAQARGFFQFTNDEDVFTTILGYVDETTDIFVPVDTMAQTGVVAGSYSAVTHNFVVPEGSPLEGRSLAFGFFIDAPVNAADGAFAGIDDIALDVVPIPEPASLGLLAAAGLGLLRRRA